LYFAAIHGVGVIKLNALVAVAADEHYCLVSIHTHDALSQDFKGCLALPACRQELQHTSPNGSVLSLLELMHKKGVF